MEHYFIAQIRIHNPKEYQNYVDAVEGVFSKYRGEYLVIDESPVVLEGNWNYTRTVLIRFPSKTEFEKWYYSDEYQEILKHRLAGAQCDTILVSGLKA